MEKVFDAHIHHLLKVPMNRAVGILQREFEQTGTEGGCFLSVPHEAGPDGIVHTEHLQNLKMLFFKHVFGENHYAFAGLMHPSDYTDRKAIKKDFLRQAEEYLSVGFDGIKMLEGYPSLLKARGFGPDDEIFDDFYAFMEKNGHPITIHFANPAANWDREKVSPHAIMAGRVYDGTYPTKDEISAQVFRVLDKFPRLRLAAAHFGFFMGEKQNAERFLGAYPNTYFDITPGGEQYFHMLKDWDYWHAFIEKYRDRIFYGSDFYPFSDDDEEKWQTLFWRRPRLIRQFFETDTEHDYMGTPFRGVALEKPLRYRIYRENAKHFLNPRTPVDKAYLVREAERLTLVPNKESPFADEDLAFILNTLKA